MVVRGKLGGFTGYGGAGEKMPMAETLKHLPAKPGIKAYRFKAITIVQHFSCGLKNPPLLHSIKM